jgi:hypothetical protein
MQETIIFPGKVEWSGENPGISLKEDPNGPFTTLASFFRVVLSPHGAGHALVLMQSPHEANPPEAAANWCLTDNEPLARWLIAEYLSHFGAFRGIAGLAGLRFRKLYEVKSAGDPRSHYINMLCCSGLHGVWRTSSYRKVLGRQEQRGQTRSQAGS